MTTTTTTMMVGSWVLVLCCRVMKVGGGLLIVMVCCINLYFVVIYVTALHSVWLYVMAALLCLSYLTFVGYLVGVLRPLVSPPLGLQFSRNQGGTSLF